MNKIIIIGSGLSGLSCAHHLKKNGFNPIIYDKSDHIGGKVYSEKINGFICDYGFQILLNNYEEVKKILNYNDLKMKYFESGAQIYHGGKILKLYNPLFNFNKFLQSDLSQIFIPMDYFHMIRTIFTKNEMRTVDYLNQTFSPNANELFLKPFFKGVFLNDGIENNFSFFKKMFSKFAFGKAGLPENGMIELPKKIIDNSNLKINLNMKLNFIKNNTAFFENGEKEKFDYIVLAIPIENINNMFNLKLNISYNSNLTLYVSSNKNILGRSLLLVPNKKYKINSIQCLSNISNNYSTNKKSLYSISTNNFKETTDSIIQEFLEITKISSNDIQFLKSYHIKKALHQNTFNIKNSNNIHFCGDWAIEPSINGALKSGRLTSENIINFV